MPADPWARAGAAIDKTFGVEIIYTGAGLAAAPIIAIRGDYTAPEFGMGGKSERSVTFEVSQSDLPQRPDGTNTFTGGGVKWKVQGVTRRDDIGKWELGAVEVGTA